MFYKAAFEGARNFNDEVSQLEQGARTQKVTKDHNKVIADRDALQNLWQISSWIILQQFFYPVFSIVNVIFLSQ